MHFQLSAIFLNHCHDLLHDLGMPTPQGKGESLRGTNTHTHMHVNLTCMGALMLGVEVEGVGVAPGSLFCSGDPA